MVCQICAEEHDQDLLLLRLLRYLSPVTTLGCLSVATHELSIISMAFPGSIAGETMLFLCMRFLSI